MNPDKVPVQTAPQESVVLNIEGSANYEGDWSEVLFSRMRNQTIVQQLVNLLYEGELAKERYYETEPFTFFKKRANGDSVLKDRNGKQVLESEIISFVPKSKDILYKELNRRLKKASLSTNVTFVGKQPSLSAMDSFWVNPFTGSKLTIRQLNTVEAHEKGHSIRLFDDSYFRKYFASGFDVHRVVFSDEEFLAFKKAFHKDDLRTDEELRDIVRENHIDYLFSANEIVERMGQLKNYFGMRGDEEFTRVHLNYARSHYVADVGYDNIRHFFQAITSETEERFLWLINNSGI